MLSGFSQEAWSSTHVKNFMEIGEALRQRYPAYGLNVWDALLDQPQWDELVRKLPTHASTSLRTVVCPSTQLDMTVIDQYIRLNMRSQSTDLRPILPLPDAICLEGEGLLGCITIQPYHSGGRCALIVAYSDCIHWFCTRSDMDHHPIYDRESRPIQRGWTGPKVDDADSAVMALLGIRCLAAGSTHIGQEMAGLAVESFRTRIIIELLCGNLNPTDDVVTPTLKDIQALAKQSSFCLDDCVPLWLRDATVLPPPLLGSPLPSSFGSMAPHDAEGLQTDLSDSSTSSTPSPNSPCGSTSPPGRRARRHRRGIRSRCSTPGRCTTPAGPVGDELSTSGDLRRVIVESLWQMVLDVRVREPGRECDLQSLWHHIRERRPSGFLTKLYGVKFCEKVYSLNSDAEIRREMRDDCLDTRPLRAEATKWMALTEACRQFDPSSDRRYVVLCAVPRGSDQAATEIAARLADQSDPLRAYLEQACELFLRALHTELPKKSLYIESYKKYEPPTDITYAALVSAESGVQLPVPRMP